MRVRERVIEAFRRSFGGAPTAVARAPGRVNLIGEHTDYNDGFVLPIAIDRELCLAVRPRADGHVVVRSLDFDASASFDLATLDDPGVGSAGREGDRGWVEYVRGVAWALGGRGHALRGWDGVLGGDVPVGAGLSSSAALEMAAVRAFGAVNDLPWNPPDAAKLGQLVENRWIGVNSGIMDQLVIAAGRREHALLIDCRALTFELVPLPAAAAVVVLDTATRRGLVDSAYNERRSQCAAAARAFGVAALRDVSLEGFAAGAPRLEAVTRRRARHVVSENWRTLEAATAMRERDLVTLGRLMNASHTSLKDDFEVTNDALDAMVEIAQETAGCLGARMTGAGFGGCAVALVSADRADGFIASVARRYRGRTGRKPQAYVCRAADGASIE
jgi:galactokinase